MFIYIATDRLIVMLTRSINSILPQQLQQLRQVLNWSCSRVRNSSQAFSVEICCCASAGGAFVHGGPRCECGFDRALVLQSEVQFGHGSFSDAWWLSAVEVRALHILPRRLFCGWICGKDDRLAAHRCGRLRKKKQCD